MVIVVDILWFMGIGFEVSFVFCIVNIINLDLI